MAEDILDIDVGLPMSSGIYTIVNKATRRAYIGQAGNLSRRFEQHRQALRCNSHHNAELQADWNQLGEPSFSFRVFSVLPTEDLQQAEYDLISKSLGPDCYNVPWADAQTKPRSIRLTDARWERLKALGSAWLAQAIDGAATGADCRVTK